MKKFLAIFLFLLIAFCGPAQALEIVRQKNVATRIVFPIVDADGDTVTGAAGLDSEIDEFADGSNPTGFADCTNEATEIGTTGVYYLNLTATEINQDYVVVQVKTTTSGAKTQYILIRTLVGDPLNLATSDDGGAINVTSGVVDTVASVTNDVGITQAGADKVWSTTTRSLTDKDGFRLSAAGVDDIWDELTSGHTTAGSYGKLLTDNINATISSRSSHSAADVWSVGTRTITGGTIDTNNDKSGYSLTQSFPANFSSLSIDTSGRVTPTPVESVVVHSGTAQAGAAGSITLASGASSTDDLYKGVLVKIYGGTGVGQARTITSYNGTTKIATVAWNWTTNPDSTSTYALIASGNPSINSSLQVSTTASDPWATALPGAYGAGTAGKILGDNLNATVSSRLAASAAPTNFSSMAITGGGAVTVGTNNDKTGYSLTQTFPTNFSSMAIDVSGRIDLGKWIGNAPNALISGRVDSNAQVVGDKSGYSLTQSFPTNFSSLAITAGGAVTIGTNNDKTGYALTAGEEDAIVDKVWDEAVSGHLTAGTTGKKLNDIPLAGSGDWSTTEKENIRDALGVTGTKTAASGGQLQEIKTTTDKFLFDASNFVKSTPQTSVTVGTNNDKTGYRLSATGVDDIWDEAQSGHATAGTFGKFLDEAISGIDDNPWDNATRTLTAFGFSVDLSAGAVDAIWDETQSGHATAGTFGKYLDEAISGIDDNPWDNATRTITGGTITTNSDKTGYSLTQLFPTNFASLAIDTNGRMDLGKWLGAAPNTLIGGRVDANAQVVGDKSGYSLTQAFPANFSSMSITAGGAVTVGTNNDKTGYTLTAGVEDAIVDKIWDESISGHLAAGTTGNKLNAASLAGDPWSTALPGSYTGNQAGFYLQDLIKKSRGR